MSDQCDWPLAVKRLACQIILQRAVVSACHEKFVTVNMLDREKVALADEVADHHMQLSKLYSNLSKELATSLITRGN